MVNKVIVVGANPANSPVWQLLSPVKKPGDVLLVMGDSAQAEVPEEISHYTVPYAFINRRPERLRVIDANVLEVETRRIINRLDRIAFPIRDPSTFAGWQVEGVVVFYGTHNRPNPTDVLKTAAALAVLAKEGWEDVLGISANNAEHQALQALQTMSRAIHSNLKIHVVTGELGKAT